MCHQEYELDKINHHSMADVSIKMMESMMTVHGYGYDSDNNDSYVKKKVVRYNIEMND